MRRISKVLTATAVGAVVILGFDGITYAATGSSLILGRVNKTVATTTIQNTKNGPALSLLTRTTAYPPFTTNAKGLVKNLYANRAVTSDTLSNRTLAQVRAGIDAATVGGKTVAKIQHDCTLPLVGYPGMNLAGCSLTGQTITVGTDLTGANMVGVDLGGAYLFQVNLTGTDLRAANISGGVALLSLSLRFADLSGSTFSPGLNTVDIQGARFDGATINGVDLTGATNADKAHFTGATFTNVTCPDSTNSSANGNTCIGHGAGA